VIAIAWTSGVSMPLTEGEPSTAASDPSGAIANP